MRGAKDTRSDAELVAVCNEGDGNAAAAAFTCLYQRHRDYVLRIALRFTSDRDLATDALQEVFAYLLRQFPPPGPGLTLTARLTTYLYPIAKNFTLSLQRKAGREDLDLDVERIPATESTRAASDDLDRLLATLTPERREILTLRFVDEMSLEDIAVVLSIPLGTVKSRLHLAIKALRDDPTAKEFFSA